MTRAVHHLPAQPGLRALAREIFRQTRAPVFQKYLHTLLVQLCRIDTTPKPDPALMRDAEACCFKILERELGQMRFSGARLERRPIDPNIQNHPHFSLLHFTKTRERPEGLSAKETYDGRCNLVFIAPGASVRGGGQSVALNAHLDVVAPYFPPRERNGIVYGRGACDDKGPVVSIIAALKVLSELTRNHRLVLNRNLVGMFVVEEETGGNGSLSLAMDRELRLGYDSVLVCECTGLKFHPANRGAVWYRASLNPPEQVSALELFAFINEEMEKEGAAIRAESDHRLFPQRPVQTCHGILGQFGEHPSRICACVSFSINLARRPNKKVKGLVQDCLLAGLANYIGLYGDKTKVKDPATGRPMVARHYALKTTQAGFVVEVYGAAGHMGAIRERDGAITKAAHLVRSLVCSKPRIEALADGPMNMILDNRGPGGNRRGPASARHGKAASARPGGAPLIIEGGQGFVPTHSMKEVMGRLRAAAERGAESFLRRIGRAEKGREVVTVVFEKLHNEAFDGDPNSGSVKNAIKAAHLCRIWKDEPILGWTVSCDARLFASEYPGLEVLTFGPGRLLHAHSDQEQIDLEEIRQAAEFLALFVLLQTGSVSPE